MQRQIHIDTTYRTVRWYWGVGAVLAMTLVLINYLTTTPVLRWNDTVANVWLLLLGVTVTWFCWVCPCLMAGDPHAKWNPDPKKQYISLRTTTHIPALILSIFCGLALLSVGSRIWTASRQLTDIWHELAYNTILQSNIRSDLSDSAVVFILTVISILAAVIVQRIVHRNCRRNAAIRKLCFDCGYDLRGNPDATTCPECGTGVPQYKKGQSNAVTHPGQGPVGHNRA